METLAEIDSCISRLSKMGAQEAFFHPDFVRLLSVLKFPYLYDGNGTAVPKEAINRILLLVAEKAEGMPKDLAGDDHLRHSETCSYVLNALAEVEIDAENADSFVRIFLEAASGGNPPRPHDKAEEEPWPHKPKLEEDGGFFDAACHRDAVFQKMLDFRSVELCESIAARISRLSGLRESAIYLFAVALEHSSSGLEMSMGSIMALAKFCRRWVGELPPGHFRRTFDEGRAHFSEKTRQSEQVISAFIRQMEKAQVMRIARVYDMQQFRARWRENRAREAAMARDGPHLAKRLRICTGRC